MYEAQCMHNVLHRKCTCLSHTNKQNKKPLTNSASCITKNKKGSKSQVHHSGKILG